MDYVSASALCDYCHRDTQMSATAHNGSKFILCFNHYLKFSRQYGIKKSRFFNLGPLLELDLILEI